MSDEDPFECPLLLPPGDNLSLSNDVTCWLPPFLDKLRPCMEEDEEDELELDRDLVLFSMFARSLGLGVVSAPIELQVCANKAKGLFLASNCKERSESEKSY